MSHLYLPATDETETDALRIRSYLAARGVEYTRWETNLTLRAGEAPEKILEAYAHELEPFMKQRGFKSADVVNVNPQMPNLLELRNKFLQEHTHSEDEVRFFVDGSGIFWFHFDDGEVAKLTCERHDFLSVPKGYRHWFDLAPNYFVQAIRIFTTTEGWVADYTLSGVEKKYQEDRHESHRP